MSKHLVLSAKRYDFTNNSGERVAGVKISYVNKKPSIRDNEFGHAPLMVSVSNEKISHEICTNVPGIFEMDFEQVTGKNNKPEIMLSDISFLQAVDLSEIFG